MLRRKEKGRLRSSVGVVLLPGPRVTLAAGPDDPPVLIPPDVHLALPAATDDNHQLHARVRILETDLAAARTSLRRMIREESTNR